MSCDIADTRVIRIAGTAAVAIGLVGQVWAEDAALGAELPVGMPTEGTVLIAILRTAGVLWALVLLLFGSRIPRLVVGTFLFGVGTAVAFPATTVSLLAATAVAWVVVAVGMGLYLVVPRLVVAVSLCWVFPALYAAHLFFSGSFDRNYWLAIGLALFGVVIGALVPERGTALLAAGLGTGLLLATGPMDASMARILGIGSASLVWQLIVLRAAARGRVSAGVTEPSPSRMRQWRAAAGLSASVYLVLLGVVSLLVPGYDSGTVSDARRLNRLGDIGVLDRPGVVFGRHNNFYLSGHAVPVAVVGEEIEGFWRLGAPVVARNISWAVGGLRAVKSDEELAVMRRAAEITSQTFADIHPMVHPGVSEAAVDRAIRDAFARHGANGIAFRGIVGSGANAVLPHYQKNDDEMTEGLVVIDIGSSVDGYASDMTRTFSVDDVYTEPERRLISTVIEAGDAAREVLAAGATMDEVDRASRDVIEAAGFGAFYTHSVGHHVGLNVHDPSRTPLAPGMVVTIEPGIYVPAGAAVDPMYWNLGVRIEDTYIITEDGWEEITSYPRTPYPVGN